MQRIAVRSGSLQDFLIGSGLSLREGSSCLRLEGADLDRPASIPLKVFYCLTVLATALLIGVSSSGWVQMGLRASLAALLLAVPPLLLMALAFHRVYGVVHWRGTLDSPPLSGVAALARTLGVALIYLGAMAGLLSLFSKPILRMLVRTPSDAGAFMLLGIWLPLAAGLGMFGILVFEYGRLIAFEAARRSAGLDEPAAIPKAMLVPTRRR